MDAQEVSLTTIGKGGLPELLAKELKKVAANMADLSTKATAVRKIVIEITVSPYPDRSGANCEFTCKASLGQTDCSSMSCSVYLAKRDGEHTLFTRDLRQELLFMDDTPPDGKTAASGG